MINLRSSEEDREQSEPRGWDGGGGGEGLEAAVFDVRHVIHSVFVH